MLTIFLSRYDSDMDDTEQLSLRNEAILGLVGQGNRTIN